MPTRTEWDGVQVRYKEAMQSFIASKEKPATVVVEEADDDGSTKDIPVITISDDNDAAAAALAPAAVENVDNSLKKSDNDTEDAGEADKVQEQPVADDEAVSAAIDEGKQPEESAVVVNPDSSITDKALTMIHNHETEVLSFQISQSQKSLYPESLTF